MFTHEPNHRDTPQLTADQRERQWLKTWEWEARIRQKTLFLKIEEFAAEQRRRH